MFSIRSASGEARLFAGRPSHFGFAGGLISFLLSATLLCTVTSAKAEYQLHAGDVIEISVARTPGTQTARSCSSGRNHLVSAVGSGFRSWICHRQSCRPRCRQCSQRRSFGKERPTDTRIPWRSIPMRSPQPSLNTGQSTSTAMSPSQATRSIARWMTVRQAIALSGGYDVTRLRMNNPILETADLRGESDSLSTSAAQRTGACVAPQRGAGTGHPGLTKKSLLDVPIAAGRRRWRSSMFEADTLKAHQVDAAG